MKTIKLLWIDDMVDWSTITQANLKIIADRRGINFNTVNACNGEDILQIIMQYDFDCVIMDYHMKPFRGDVYIKEIRNEDHLEHIPILFYSQDNNTKLESLVVGLKNITTVFRPNLEDKIIELFF